MKKLAFVLLAALVMGLFSAQAQKPKKKVRTKAATTKVAAAPRAAATVENFDGEFTNSYNDGIGGVATHLLTINFNAATGEATGKHTNESGVERTFTGKLEGNKLVCYYDEDGDKFADITLLDANTLKLAGFTGTFKRNTGGARPVSENVGPSGNVPVDPNLYEIQRIQQQRQQQAQDPN